MDFCLVRVQGVALGQNISTCCFFSYFFVDDACRPMWRHGFTMWDDDPYELLMKHPQKRRLKVACRTSPWTLTTRSGGCSGGSFASFSCFKNCTCTFMNYLFIAKTSISIRCKYNPSNAWFIHKLYSRCFFGKRKHLPPILLVMACSWFLSSRMWVSNFTTWRWWIAGGSFCLGRITILGSYLDSFSASSQKTLVGKIGCNKRWQPTFSGDLSLKVYGRFWEWEKGWFEFRFFVSIAVYFLDHSCPKFEKVQHLHTCS